MKPPTLAKDDRVKVTYPSRFIDMVLEGHVALCSPNGLSIAIVFDRVDPHNSAVLPLMWNGCAFTTLVTGDHVNVERAFDA